ncbi:MAG: putative Ig domain-containing protein [Candidatus Pacearchaeota archaeon]
MKSKLLIIPLMVIFFISIVSAASVTTSLFFESTTEDSFSINYGEGEGIIISADSIFEPSMDITLELLNNSGDVIAEILNVTTTSDSYSNYIVVGPAIYPSPGEYTLISTVVAEGGDTDTSELYLTVRETTPENNVPIILSTAPSEVNEGQIYSYKVTATDEDGDVLTYSLTENPSWLSIDSETGLISGTAPEVDEDYQFIVTVEVSDGKDSTTQTFTIDVLDTETSENNVPVSENLSVVTDFETAVTIALEATDEDGDVLVFEIVEGPNDGSLSSFDSNEGTVTYTPDTDFSGPDTFTFRTNDGEDYSNVATVSITVNSENVDENNAPEITSNPLTEINESEFYEYQIIAEDEDGDVLTYSLTENPSWLSIDSETGLISGTAPEVEENTEFSVRVMVSDGEDVDDQSFNVTVFDVFEDDEKPKRKKSTQEKEGPIIFEDEDDFTPRIYDDPIDLTGEEKSFFNENTLIWMVLIILAVLIAIVTVYLSRYLEY